MCTKATAPPPYSGATVPWRLSQSHQLEKCPEEKPPSTVDIDLPNFVEDDEYLTVLRTAYEPLLTSFRPQLLIFVAGADPYREDRLGGLSLSREGLQRRDGLIFELAGELRVPVAVVLAGGYATNVTDTVSIHCNTVRAAARTYRLQ